MEHPCRPEGTRSMTTPDETTGLSRRAMLRRSAAVGGTLLWVTPTVSVLSATAAVAGSAPPHGDGSKLAASYYILSIKCGTDYYLIKVGKDDSGKTPFIVETGPQVKGAN